MGKKIASALCQRCNGNPHSKAKLGKVTSTTEGKEGPKTTPRAPVSLPKKERGMKESKREGVETKKGWGGK